jgi:hypothetical protein
MPSPIALSFLVATVSAQGACPTVGSSCTGASICCGDDTGKFDGVMDCVNGHYGEYALCDLSENEGSLKVTTLFLGISCEAIRRSCRSNVMRTVFEL